MPTVLEDYLELPTEEPSQILSPCHALRMDTFVQNVSSHQFSPAVAFFLSRYNLIPTHTSMYAEKMTHPITASR